jgi:hypothetical protein
MANCYEACYRMSRVLAFQEATSSCAEHTGLHTSAAVLRTYCHLLTLLNPIVAIY